MIKGDHEDFPGFPQQIQYATWQFPTIINGFAHTLSGSEFKVLWYILRHTFGWNKTTDKLSLSQICNGIKKKDGEQLDYGTGLSRPWVVKALEALSKRKFISIKKMQGKPNEITLNITSKENYLVKKINHTSKETLPVASKETLLTIYNNTITNTNNNISSQSEDGEIVSNKEISLLIDLFKPINPDYKKLFAIPSQRKSIARLAEKYGFTKMESMLKRLPDLVSQRYAPMITTPYQLEKKFAELVLFAKRQKGGANGKSNLTIIRPDPDWVTQRVGGEIHN